MYGSGLGAQRNVPSWALMLVGGLIGFLCAMAIFKFTGMGDALRWDLYEEGQKKATDKYEKQIKQLMEAGYGEVEDEPDPATEPDPDGGGADDGGGTGEPEPEPEPEPAGDPE